MPRAGSAKLPDPPPGVVPLGPPLRAPPQTRLISSRSALAVASKPCQGPTLTKAGSGRAMQSYSHTFSDEARVLDISSLVLKVTSAVSNPFQLLGLFINEYHTY